MGDLRFVNWPLKQTQTLLYDFFQEASEENEKLVGELRRSKDKSSGNRCSVCLANICEVALQPCGHVCLCRDCVQQLCPPGVGRTGDGSFGRCPVCRSKIERHHHVYLS
jgi:hypothetical protein